MTAIEIVNQIKTVRSMLAEAKLTGKYRLQRQYIVALHLLQLTLEDSLQNQFRKAA